MAFKGTDTIGTRNWTLERQALAAVEAAYDRLEQEKRRGRRADPARIEKLTAALRAAIEKADSFVASNEFDRILEENGAVGLNASTGMDQTQYFYSLPANKAELWFLLESERFRKPVLREFYKERDVVREERRMRVESSPQGKLVEALIAAAFAAHPYRNMPGGWASDIENLRARDAGEFYRRYYVPANITIGIAGDVDPKQMRAFAARYFGPLAPGPLPPPVVTVEPPLEGERRVTVESPAQPLLLFGYPTPDQTHPDDTALDVLNLILSGGRTGRLYKDLVVAQKIALAAASQTGFPGAKYPGLLLVFLVPAAGHTVEENEKAALAVIEKLRTEKVDEATLARVKTQVRAGVIRKLASNPGLAAELPAYHVAYGDWRKLFRGIEEVEKITADDVQRVARQYLVPQRRTVAYTVAPAKADGKGEGQ
jgi:predicted Zn-dependent peptidase